MPSKIIPVIMCGGAGTRLWPASRESMPKQFIPLFAERSTFQETALRVAKDDLFEKPVVITSADFRFIVADQLRQAGVEADIVLEPVRRDSGPAVAVATVLGLKRWICRDARSELALERRLLGHAHGIDQSGAVARNCFLRIRVPKDVILISTRRRRI